MGFSLKKFLEEATAQINPLDGGKTAQTVRAARTQAPPAQTVKSSPAPARSVGDRLFGKNSFIRDQFDANTQADIQRRIKVNQPKFYADQQELLRTQGKVNPINVIRNEFKPALKETLTQPTSWDKGPRLNVGDFKGSGIIEDFVNSPFKMGKGGVQVGQGQVKQGAGNIVSGAIEGPLGLLPVGRVAQLGKGTKLTTRLVSGAKQGLKEGAVYGGAYGASVPMAENRDWGDVAQGGAIGAVTGGVGGALLGGGAPVVGAGAKVTTKLVKQAPQKAVSTAQKLDPVNIAAKNDPEWNHWNKQVDYSIQQASRARTVQERKQFEQAAQQMIANRNARVKELRQRGSVQNPFYKETNTDYRSAHQIDSKTAKNLGEIQNIDDKVAQIKSKYGLTNYDQKDITNLKKIIGNPEADVKIYRASPKNELNPGDWVTTSKTYANDIKRQNGGKVYEYTVKAKELNLPANIEDNPSLARFSAFQFNKNSAIDPLESLKQEAGKYKSAEEFVNDKYRGDFTTHPANLDNLKTAGAEIDDNGLVTLYHGTNAKGSKGIDQTGFNEGSFFATDPKASQTFNYGTVKKIKVPIEDLTLVQSGGMAGSGGTTVVSHARLVKGADGIYRADKTPYNKQQLTDLYNQATQSPKSPPKSATKNQAGFIKNPFYKEPTLQDALEGRSTTPLTKKVKTVYETDKVLKDLQKKRKQLVKDGDKALEDADTFVKEYAMSLKQMDVGNKGGQLIPDGEGGYRRITEHTPFYSKFYKENGRKPNNDDYELEALRQLESGKADFGPEAVADYQKLLAKSSGDAQIDKAIKARQDELSLLPIDAKTINKPPKPMSENEWDSLAMTAPFQNKTTKQAVGQELAGIREELKAFKLRTAELREKQRIQAIAGNFDEATKIREQNKQAMEAVKQLQTREKQLAQDYAKNFPERPKLDDKPVTGDDLVKGLDDKQRKQNFNDITNKYLGGQKAGEVEAVSKAKSWNANHGHLSDKQKLEVILNADNSSFKTKDPAVQKAVKEWRNLFDEEYKYFTQDKGLRLGYQHEYMPRIYKTETGELITPNEYRLLQLGSSRQKSRSNLELDVDKLETTDPAEIFRKYHANLERASAGQKYLNELEQQGLVTKSPEYIKGLKPIVAEGMQDNGFIYYAKPDVADKLNKIFGTQEASGFFEKSIEKAQGFNSFVQSLVLSGGVPNTPINAFGIMQLMKNGMALHPIQGGKAMLVGLNRKHADKFFDNHKDYIKIMAENGLDTRYSYRTEYKKLFSDVKGQEKATGVIREGWNDLTNDATFDRFMPALEVLHFKNVYNGLGKKMPPEQAAKVATQATANFFGKNTLAKDATRSKVASDAAGAFLFAPRFREAMLNFWVKNAKSLDPRGGFKNARSVEYRDNVKFMAAAGAVYAAMEGANYAINGNFMHDNPDGKKDKLLIPMGDGEKVIGVPFLPSIATVPRNAIMAGYNTVTGNLDEAGKNVQSFFSIPLRTGTELLTNENYFGGRIVDEDATTPERLTQAGSHVLKNNMQPWLREGLNVAGQGLPEGAKKALGIKKQSGFETASKALEAPLRFYDPQYFKGGKYDKPLKDTPEDIAKSNLTPEQRKLTKMKASERNEILANDPEAKKAYQSYKNSLKGLTSRDDTVADLPEGMSEQAIEALVKHSRMTETAQKKVYADPKAKLEYDLAKLEKDFREGKLTEEEAIAKAQKLTTPKTTKAKTSKKSSGRRTSKSRKSYKLFAYGDPTTTTKSLQELLKKARLS